MPAAAGVLAAAGCACCGGHASAAAVLPAAADAGSGTGPAAAGRARGVPGRAIAAGEHRPPGAVPTGSPTRSTGAATPATGTARRAPFSPPGLDASAGGPGRRACPAEPGSGRPPAQRRGWSAGRRRGQRTLTRYRHAARAPGTARARGRAWPRWRRARGLCGLCGLCGLADSSLARSGGSAPGPGASIPSCQETGDSSGSGAGDANHSPVTFSPVSSLASVLAAAWSAWSAWSAGGQLSAGPLAGVGRNQPAGGAIPGQSPSSVIGPASGGVTSVSGHAAWGAIRPGGTDQDGTRRSGQLPPEVPARCDSSAEPGS